MRANRRNERRANRRNDRGAVLVEYAFSFPVLMLTVMAALSLLWLVTMKVALGQAAREGARFASTATPPTYRTHPDAAEVADRINHRVPLLDLTDSNIALDHVNCPTGCANGRIKVTVTINTPAPIRLFAPTISTTTYAEVRAE